MNPARRCFIFGILACILALSLSAQQVFTLSRDWTFCQERLRNWHPAVVPGTVHTDLLALGYIEDPFLGMNERSVQWIDKEDWLYDNHFVVTEAQQQSARRELTFYGLDTYADVYLNDSLILKADNMFRTWRVDVSRLTRVGENHLRVRLHSPIKVDMPKWERFPDQYHASSDQSENGGLLNRRLSPFIRKAPYHYGWDWGPRLVAMGIWRPVEFAVWNDAVIRDIFVEQQEVNRKRATILHHVTIEAEHETEAVISVTDSASHRCLASQKVTLHRGTNEFSLPYTISHPRLWWTNGFGEPYLYIFQTSVEGNSSPLTSNLLPFTLHHSSKIGLRSVQLHREADADGEAFYFTLNGEKVFMKGANYIPCDVFLPRVNDSIYWRTISDAASANMNMIRVWGGGVYEDNRFYELCDELGILVWQDFMFACSMYPADEAFLENIRQEAIDNVRRLRNHPCIALWCGNNEVLDAWVNWGWKRQSEQRGGGQAERLWAEHKSIFFKTLPEVVAQYAPQTPYRPSSPYAREDGRRDLTRGDYHYWEVWHAQKPISEYNRVRARFFSEYGMQSFPELTTVRRFAPNPTDWHIDSDVMLAHQRGGAHANQLIERYLEAEYGRPAGFDTLLYVGQLMQGDAMKTAVEAHRRDKGYCWGSLVWQINDCWPVASWSTRDYYGRWKAAHYMLRRAMSDILVSPIQQPDGTLSVTLVNDRLSSVRGQLTIEVWNASERRYQATQRVSVKPNSANEVWKMSTHQLLAQAGIQENEAIIHAEFLPEGKAQVVYSNNYTLVSPKDLRLKPAQVHFTLDPSPLMLRIEPLTLHPSSFTLHLSTDNYARGIFLTLEGDDNHHFSDNYFDLLPGETRTISVTTTLPAEELSSRLRVMTYR